eukprot:1159025-Pelagomonas_calceolata.AAC.1
MTPHCTQAANSHTHAALAHQHSQQLPAGTEHNDHMFCVSGTMGERMPFLLSTTAVSLLSSEAPKATTAACMLSSKGPRGSNRQPGPPESCNKQLM